MARMPTSGNRRESVLLEQPTARFVQILDGDHEVVERQHSGSLSDPWACLGVGIGPKGFDTRRDTRRGWISGPTLRLCAVDGGSSGGRDLPAEGGKDARRIVVSLEPRHLPFWHMQDVHER